MVGPKEFSREKKGVRASDFKKGVGVGSRGKEIVSGIEVFIWSEARKRKTGQRFTSGGEQCTAKKTSGLEGKIRVCQCAKNQGSAFGPTGEKIDPPGTGQPSNCPDAKDRKIQLGGLSKSDSKISHRPVRAKSRVG